MPKATGKDHSQVNLAIWGDEAFLDLTPSAQHLFFVLWTSPSLSYCGTGEWHAGKIAARARGWTASMVNATAVELNTAPEQYLVIDPDTEEFLLRSWIKHDGICRRPNMAVSMANARADVASRQLRAVIVHEVRKIAKNESELSAWERDAVKDLLGQKSIDPATLPPYNPPIDPRANPSPNPSANGYGPVDANPPADPPRTPAPAPAPFLHFSNGGYESSEGHQGANPVTGPPPTRFCPTHPNGTPDGCLDCQRQSRQAAIDARRAELDQAAIDRAIEIAECELCDDDGYRGAVVCDHREHSTPEGRAAAMALAKAAES
jgi:hypothetical protein